ncbi:hypothetical protein NUW54_g11394 [Trametes sanguinea]|uniref:Uncharacterized protein n=1 Tax=Trametes sanguinea TaxID=158606 RepID=A0ACC1NF81_9APHY|nr:hypothetical protein NUW54_g11394 [Trametes sanguinea]
MIVTIDTTHDLRVDIAPVLVDAGEGQGDCAAALRGCCLYVAGSREDKEDASEQGGERESELHRGGPACAVT